MLGNFNKYQTTRRFRELHIQGCWNFIFLAIKYDSEHHLSRARLNTTRTPRSLSLMYANLPSWPAPRLIAMSLRKLPERGTTEEGNWWLWMMLLVFKERRRSVAAKLEKVLLCSTTGLFIFKIKSMIITLFKNQNTKIARITRLTRFTRQCTNSSLNFLQSS